MITDLRSTFRWGTVAGSFVMLALTYSTWYSFSVFLVALVRDQGWSRSLASGAFSLFVLVQAMTGPFAGFLVDRLGPRLVMILGSAMLGTGLMFSGLIRSWWQFYISFGIVAAGGLGTAGWISHVTLIQQRFRRRRGLAIGIGSSGIGLGFLVSAPLAQYLIERIGWRQTYHLMAIFITLVNSLIASLFLRNPEKEGQICTKNCTSTGGNLDAPTPKGGQQQSILWTVEKAWRTRVFWLLTGAFFVSGMGTQSILTHHVAFLIDSGVEPMIAASIAALVGMTSIVGKAMWGGISDRIGREETYFAGVFCAVSGIVFLAFIHLFRKGLMPYAYAIFFGLGYASCAALPPIITADFFAGPSYGRIFGTIMTLNGFGGAFGAWFAGFVHDHTKSYLILFLTMILCFLFSGCAVWKAAPSKVRSVSGNSARH